MRRCFYHTDLGQNAVLHNFAIQIALIKYSGRWNTRGLLAKLLKKFPPPPPWLTHITSISAFSICICHDQRKL